MNSELESARLRFLGEYPLASEYLDMPATGISWLWKDFCTHTTVQSLVQGCQRYFAISEDKYAAQLWFHMWCGSAIAPTLKLGIASDVVADLSFGDLENRDRAPLFLCGAIEEADRFWVGYCPTRCAQGFRQCGYHAARACTELIAVLIELYDVRPAPLWAVAFDALNAAVLGIGNDEFEPREAVVALQELYQGIADFAHEYQPAGLHYYDVDILGFSAEELSAYTSIKPGRRDYSEWVARLDLEEEPEYTATLRKSCCLIYNSPQAELCSSCPKHPREQRVEAIRSYLRSMG